MLLIEAKDLKSEVIRKLREARDLGLQIIGIGGGRLVFDLGNGNVIKIAKNQQGSAQNKKEISGYKKLGQLKKYFNEIIEGNEIYIIAPKIDVFKSIEEFNDKMLSAFGITFEDLEKYDFEGEDYLEEMLDGGDMEEFSAKIIRELYKASQILGIRFEEFLVPSHFGIRNGNPVIVDWGGFDVNEFQQVGKTYTKDYDF